MHCLLRTLAAMAALFHLTFSAIVKHEVKSLPGWDLPLPSRQYSGYLPVDAATKHYRFLHYWVSESMSNPATDPVVLWLTGGPGCSSMAGYFLEMGPILMNTSTSDVQLLANPYTWNQNATLIFLESPAGVGFSYSTNKADYITNDTMTAEDNFRFLVNFFAAYPEYATNDFYISGESYAGIYIPTLAEVIRTSKSNINLKGLLVGNGCVGNKVGGCGDSEQSVPIKIKFVYGHGLISEGIFSELQDRCGLKLNEIGVYCKEMLETVDVRTNFINVYDIYAPCIQSDSDIFWTAATEHVRRLRDLGFTECGAPGGLLKYMNQPDVRAAIHVESAAELGDWKFCAKLNYTGNVDSLLGVYPDLIAKYRVLIYSGDVDACVPYTGSEEWTSGLGYDFGVGWRPWDVNGRPVGYVTEYKANGFTFATLRGAGHQVPLYKPMESLAMFQRFLANVPL
ncbi:uncharacterized protein [Oscarella lobularis]|uniref:uncharacterized protein n=1 Tax=Oscarella lobularis TaxID=121494 RepID=UPI00331399BC